MVSMAHGYLLIGPEHVQVLGGKVAVLVEKWELNRVSIYYMLYFIPGIFIKHYLFKVFCLAEWVKS